MVRAVSAVCVIAVLAGIAAVQVAAAGLGEARRVYFWPMSYGFDHYLADQATTEDVFDVVVDPKLAQAIMTERIDSKFLDAMDEFFPQPEEEDKEAKEEEEEEEAETGGIFSGDGFLPERPLNQPVGRSKGTLFLVDVVSRQILWSTYLKEFDPAPNELHKQARSVVQRFKKGLAPTVP